MPSGNVSSIFVLDSVQLYNGVAEKHICWVALEKILKIKFTELYLVQTWLFQAF